MKKMKNNYRTIVHVDMDAFYASIEQLDHPDYSNKPVVVGADPRGGRGRGVVSAASYEAREFGIHSAMPISRAYRLCPHGIYVKPRMKRYVEVSKHVMRILYDFSPLVEQISIDEAFLDCTGTEKLIGVPESLARRIKQRIHQETRLTASVGVAPNKSLAKIASELSKPNGLTICQPGKEKDFLAELPLKYLWGAGKVTLQKLQSLGYRVIGDIASCSREKLEERLGKLGAHLWYLANGIDERAVVAEGHRKSISEETTFSQDISSDRTLELVIFKISDRLTRKMRNLGIKGRTVTLKIRLEGFETYTRSHSLPNPVNDMHTVREIARNLYRNFDRRGKKVRLIGVGMSNLGEGETSVTEQLELFQKVQEKSFESFGAGLKRGEGSEDILDKMKKKYGEKVTRAVFLPKRVRRD
jgi:nucleotidyltransferase/DNA polymerase involved in DNA repair